MCFCLSFNHVLLELAYSKHKLPLEFKASKKVVASSRSSAFTFSFRFSSWIFPFGFFSRSSSHPYWMYELILSDKKKKYHIKTSLTISCQNYKSGSFQQATANMSIIDRDVIGTWWKRTNIAKFNCFVFNTYSCKSENLPLGFWVRLVLCNLIRSFNP